MYIPKADPVLYVLMCRPLYPVVSLLELRPSLKLLWRQNKIDRAVFQPPPPIVTNTIKVMSWNLV